MGAMPPAHAAPLLAVEAVELFERDVRLRMPFRFGVVTLREAPQAFVRVRVRLADGRTAEGVSAELLAPKWFDKNPALDNAANFEQLRDACRVAAALYTDGTEATAFGHFARHHATQIERCAAAHGLNVLTANFGPALVDGAVLDALCRAAGLPFHAALRANLPGIVADSGLTPDLAGTDVDAFLAGLAPSWPATIEARHTVGLVDAIDAGDPREPVGDGLPETLAEVVAAYGHRWFKLKVAGDVAADVERLARIASVLDRIPGGYRASLDGNEQYDDVEGVVELLARMDAEPRLATLVRSIAFVEQPVKRQAALAKDIAPLAARVPVIVDESDDTLDAFVRARAVGYRGVSSKTCKGLYRSILNRARCARWNAEEGAPGRYFMSAEDLTIQAGLALQQDLALVAALGIEHVERNGHHYVDGMAALPEAEQRSFLDAHPDLYERSHGAVRVAIRDGRLAIGSLGAGAGYASGGTPDWSAMRRF
jgi:L-alanine-DL-glutamate epimerase-like enolase superfamily enzyme